MHDWYSYVRPWCQGGLFWRYPFFSLIWLFCLAYPWNSTESALCTYIPSILWYVFCFVLFWEILPSSYLCWCSVPFSQMTHIVSFMFCLAPLFITSGKKMVFLKFSTQTLFTFRYSVSFAGFLRYTWRKQTDKNTRQRIANLLNCDSDISLDIKILRYFDMLSWLS